MRHRGHGDVGGRVRRVEYARLADEGGRGLRVVQLVEIDRPESAWIALAVVDERRQRPDDRQGRRIGDWRGERQRVGVVAVELGRRSAVEVVGLSVYPIGRHVGRSAGDHDTGPVEIAQPGVGVCPDLVVEVIPIVRRRSHPDRGQLAGHIRLPLLIPGLEGGKLSWTPPLGDPEAGCRQAERLERCECGPLTVRGVAEALDGAVLRDHPAGQGAQRDAVQAGRRGRQRAQAEGLTKLFEENQRPGRGRVPLLGASSLPRRGGVAARLEVLRSVTAGLERSERVQCEPLVHVLDDARGGGRVAGRHERVGAHPDQDPGEVGVHRHHAIGEPVDPRDAPVGILRRRPDDEIGLRLVRGRRAHPDAAH
jgi:hypothetical protein